MYQDDNTQTLTLPPARQNVLRDTGLSWVTIPLIMYVFFMGVVWVFHENYAYKRSLSTSSAIYRIKKQLRHQSRLRQEENKHFQLKNSSLEKKYLEEKNNSKQKSIADQIAVLCDSHVVGQTQYRKRIKELKQAAQNL